MFRYVCHTGVRGLEKTSFKVMVFCEVLSSSVVVPAFGGTSCLNLQYGKGNIQTKEQIILGTSE